MAHLRRIHYQGKRCCSTPAVASLPDFSDKYFEEIKKKIQAKLHLDEDKSSEKKRKQAIDSNNNQVNKSPSTVKLDNQAKESLKVNPQEEPLPNILDYSLVGDRAVIFSLDNQVGGLVRALRIFQELGINVQHIESRPSKSKENEYEIYVDIDCEDKDKMSDLLHHLRHEVDGCTMEEYQRSKHKAKSFEKQRSVLMPQLSIENEMILEGMPWFPRRIEDLNLSATRVLMYGTELDADHPGFKDPIYRERRKFFSNIAFNYKYPDKIPKIDYTEEETRTWGVIFKELTKLYALHACKVFNDNLQLLIKYAGYRENKIPQLETISNFLKNRTGFILRPVAGYLSARDFLAGLAFRVFHCTQYIRHSSDPFYTPEPDCVHEILGHCPLLADQSFAQFSQEIGLASLGASDEEVDKLATCYFFTVEFGLCKQNNELKVYGAGLLSSAAELKHAVSSSAHVLNFNPVVTCQQTPMITTYQEVYFYTDSFEQAKEMMRDFAATIKRPFGVRYNAYTQSVEILSNTAKIMTLVSELKGDLCIVTNALQKIKKDEKKIDEEVEDEEDVQDYLLREITNISRRNSDTHLDCQKLEQEKENGQFLDPNAAATTIVVPRSGSNSPEENNENIAQEVIKN